MIGAALALAAMPLQDAPAAAPERAWTFFVYGAADNNADGHMFEFIADLRRTLAGRPGVELILFMDRHEHHSKDARALGEDFTGARLYRLGPDSAERLDGGAEFPAARRDAEWEADSADPATLGQFLRFGKARFPARHHALLIYSHANGITMCPDEATDTEMDVAGLGPDSCAGAEVQWTALELCNMGSFDVACQWRPGRGGFGTDYLVAIPNAGPPLDWARIFARFDPAMTPRELSLLAIAEGGAGRRAFAQAHPERAAEVAHEAVAAYDLSAAAAAKSAVGRFAAAAGRDPQARATLEGLRGGLLNYCGGDFRAATAFVDLPDLLAQAAASEKLSDETRAAARAALKAVDALVLDSFAMDGYPGFAPGRNGAFIPFPDGAAPVQSGELGRASLWRQYSWYAAWDSAQAHPAGAGEPEIGSGSRAVASWYQLLDSWYGAPQ